MKGTLGYKVRTIVCAGCGKEATGHFRPKQRYCSHPCFAAAAKPHRRTGETRACAVCGAGVYVPVNRLQRAEDFFCSTAHANEWQGRRKDAYVCKTCGRSFKWPKSRAAGTNPTYCTLACRDADPARREMLIAMNVRQARLRPNGLERAGYAILDSIGIAYEPQRLIGGKFCVDAFASAIGLVVQFDGDYWHGNPARFPEPNARQRRRISLDASQDTYMRACGHAVLRLWESDIRKRPDHVKEALLAAVAERKAACHRPEGVQASS